jgi:biopolymer transport protein ExbD
MKLPRNAKVFRGQLDAAPFASVAFLLLIFLVLESKLVFTPGVRVDIDLPEVAAVLPGTAQRTVVVAIDRTGLIYYEGQQISLLALKSRLRDQVQKSREPLALDLRADKGVTLESTLPLLALAHQVGIREALFATRTRLEPVSRGARP